MKMDLIQPFIGSLDTVLAEMMRAPAKIADLAMEEDGYRQKGSRGRWSCSRDRSKGASFSIWSRKRRRKSRAISREPKSIPAEPIVPEAVCELANMVIGNAVTQLNDRGFQFKVFPPAVLTEEQCAKAGQDSEATILCFETPCGNVHLNIAMHYHARRSRERAPMAV